MATWMTDRSVAISQLLGAVLFAFGSACFVWSSWVDDWVLPMRIGCGSWIGGCVPYLWPPLVNERKPAAERMHISNVLQVCAMLSWAVGSAFAFVDDIDSALPVVSANYLAGSTCLLCDALLQGQLAMTLAQLNSAAAPIARDERVSLVADVLAGIFYVLAGAFGGYATLPGLLRFGNAC